MAAPSQQRRLLFRRPFPPPLNPRNNLHVHRSGLLLELQKEAPQEANIAAKAALRYTWQGGRLQKFWGFDPTSTSAVDFPHLENHWPQRLANSRAGRRPRGEHGPGRKIRIEPPWSRRWETELATIVLRWEAVRSLRVLPLDAAVPCARAARFSQHTPSVGIGARIVSRNLGAIC
jgi:hypothetical protein